MTKVFVTLLALILLLYGALVAFQPNTPEAAQPVATSTEPVSRATSVLASNLSIPWDIAFLPDASLLVTERPGQLAHIQTDGTLSRIPISKQTPGESGLLGITLHPGFSSNHFVYLYMSEQSGSETLNRVVRYVFSNDELSDAKVIIDKIPGAIYHDGGRMEFGPDGKLYVTTGDAYRGANAQDLKSLAGKILRLNDDGSIPTDNPFGTAVWSYGHRNPQGLAWDTRGNLWETEHGPTGEGGRCCHDEINLIVKGGNYGWPAIIGDEKRDGMISPVLHSGNDTWAPASLVYANGSLYFGGLISKTLFEAKLNGTSTPQLIEHLKDAYGRIRTVRIANGSFYVTTSNTDGRGTATSSDDRVINLGEDALR